MTTRSNLTLQCGSSDLRIWDRATDDFGRCFFQLFIQLPTCGFLAVVSAYYIGKRWPILTYFGAWNACQSGLIYTRSALVSALTLVSLCQLIIHAALFHHSISFLEVSQVTLSTLAWSLHLVYVLLLKRGNSFNTRGPKMAMLAWFLVAVASVLQFRSRYVAWLASSFKPPIYDLFQDHLLSLWTSAVEVMLHGLYLCTLIPGSTHLEQRHYRHRSQVNDIVYNAYESQENNSFVGFDTEDEGEGLPLGVAKENASFLSRLLFLWVSPLIRKGACGFLKESESLFDLPHSISTGSVAHEFHQLTSSRRLSLLKALHIRFGLEFYSIGLIKLVSDGAGFCGPILLNCLVSYIEDADAAADQSNPDSIWQGYAYVGGMFCAVFIGALANSHFNMKMAEVNLKIRAALITSIYRKTIQLRQTTLGRFSAGEIINFMSTDTDRIVNFCPSFHAFWSLPVQVAVTLYLLYQQIGVAFLAGVLFAILLIPINRLLANKIGELSTKMMEWKDQRVKLMSEILYGIRVLKFHAWEDYFAAKVSGIREKEIKNLKGRKYLDALCVYFWATTPVLVSLFSFGAYILLGNQLTAAKVFTSIALFNMLISPLNALPWVLNGVVEAWVSLKRISKLFQVEEPPLSQIYSQMPKERNTDLELSLKEGLFRWSANRNQAEQADASEAGNLLRVPAFHLKRGSFVGVVGEVGSGKTSLLLALLGELDKLEGELCFQSMREGVGLVLQEAWIQRGTIRSNICFAPNTNFNRYKRVIEACCLNEDLDCWATRDDTPVGDSGVTLSGGQRIRLTLARAVYQNYKVYFLDDVFSAVDYKVAQQIYEQCVMGVLKDKTRLVCTHHVKFLRHADWVLVMDKGELVRQGPPEEILRAELEESGEEAALPATQRGPWREDGEGPTTPLDQQGNNPLMSQSSLSFELQKNGEEPYRSEDLDKEHQEEGSIQLKVYQSYYKAVGSCLCWLILLSMVAMQASRNLNDLWLAHWLETGTPPNGTAPENGTTTPSPRPTFETPVQDVPLFGELDPQLKYYFSILLAIGLANSVFTLFRAFLFAFGGIQGALKIHADLLSSVLWAKMTFFDSNSVGRLINRFSSDVATVDDSLPFITNILLAQTFGLVGTLVVTCYALPWIICVIIPLLLVCNNIQEYYRHTARQLRRLGSVSLSPVYAHFSETLKGLVTIRAMKAMNRFEELAEAFLESSQKCQYSTQAVSQWLSFRLQMVGLIVISGVGLLAVFQHHFGSADPGIIGLALSYALTVTNGLSGFVTFFTETEKEMVAVERTCEYIERIEPEEQEAPRVGIPYLWPAQGVVHFKEIWLRYKPELPFVLRKLTFDTRPAEKVGVVGRTGSGKSSLFMALFRLAEYKGQISIDNVDVKLISLKDLRTRLCIIPQDPLIFSGSLRENLDPTGEFCDDDLMRAVEKCQLKQLVDSLELGLDTNVGEAGGRLSTGQKQLVCLARAVLVNAKVLCIDEATANVDQETDKIIQSTLRTSFANATVITVAHRVNTVLHCDRVLVMSNGEIREFDDPGVLMQKQDSHFYKLAHGLL